MNAPKKSAKPVKANPGQVYAAAMELTTVISTFEEFGIPFPLMSTADANVRAAKNEEAALGTCFEEVRRLTDELWGGWPESGEKDKWGQIEKILALKNWPDAGWIVEQARESIPASELVCGPGGNCGGCGKCSAPRASAERDCTACDGEGTIGLADCQECGGTGTNDGGAALGAQS